MANGNDGRAGGSLTIPATWILGVLVSIQLAATGFMFVWQREQDAAISALPTDAPLQWFYEKVENNSEDIRVLLKDASDHRLEHAVRGWGAEHE